MWAAARVGRGWRQPQVSCRLLGLVCMGWDTFMSGQMALDISAKVMFAGMAYTDAAVMPLMMPFDGSTHGSPAMRSGCPLTKAAR